MDYATTPDGVRLYYEEAGEGRAVVFVHEFAGDHRSWEPQMRHFARRYRCVTYSARGYPPSDVPHDAEMYSQAHAADDILAVMDHLGIDRAHIVGLSMGGFTVEERARAKPRSPGRDRTPPRYRRPPPSRLRSSAQCRERS